MSRHDSFHLLSRKFSTATLVKSLEKLGDLQIKSLTSILLVELYDLPLNFFHNLNLTLEQFGEGANSIVPRLLDFAVLQGHLCLLNFADKSASYLFLCPRNNEVQKLFIAHY